MVRPGDWTRRALAPGRGEWADVAIAVAATAAISATVASNLEGDADPRLPIPVAYVLAAAMGAVLLVRRRRPLGVLVVTIVLILGYYGLGFPVIGVGVPIAGAVFTLAEAGRLRPAIAASGGFVMFTTLFRIIEGGENIGRLLGYDLVTTLALLASVIALGDALHSRRRTQTEAAERVALAERDREREAERRVEAERVRIARELHDVLAHTVSVISVQAGLAAEAVRDDPETAQQAIGAIRITSKEAMTELRSALGVLRRPDGSALRSPVSGLADLDRVVARARAGGLDVAVEVQGRPVVLPAVIDSAAHRIVQESMTNVVRHAGAAHARVALMYRPDTVTVRIDDDGHGVRSVPMEGFGIRGMRERVGVLGGRLTAGNREGGGFSVEAELPIGTAS